MSTSDTLPSSALVYLPAIGAVPGDAGIRTLAPRLRKALARAAGEDVEYRLEAGVVIPTSEGRMLPAQRIVRSVNGKDECLLDIFEFSYNDQLLDRFERFGLLRKAWLVAVMFITESVRFAHFLFRGVGMSWRQRVTMLWASMFFIVLFVYMLTLIEAIVKILGQLGPWEHLATVHWAMASKSWIEQTLPTAWGTVMWVDAHAPEIVVALTALGLMAPSLTSGLSRAAAALLSITAYIETGERRPNTIGRLGALIDQLCRHQPRYTRVDFITYSFGGVIALDALFPATTAPRPTWFDRVGTLATIGIPFDLVRTFWPQYYTQRDPANGAPKRWFNVYIPLDLIGSNFSNAEGKAEPSADVPLTTSAGRIQISNIAYDVGGLPERTSLISGMLLRGLSAHTRYWDTEDTDAEDCFLSLVPAMFKGDPLFP